MRSGQGAGLEQARYEREQNARPYGPSLAGYMFEAAKGLENAELVDFATDPIAGKVSRMVTAKARPPHHSFSGTSGSRHLRRSRDVQT